MSVTASISWQTVVEYGIAGTLSGTVIAVILRVAFLRRTKTLQASISEDLERRWSALRVSQDWKRTSVAELLGPRHMQLDRTRRAFDRWQKRNIYLEAKVIREGNVAARDLLLDRGHLIPPELLDDAGKLIEHYDRWLEEFERVRSAESPENDTAFVYVGPAGFPFPEESDQRFRAAFRRLWDELYGEYHT